MLDSKKARRRESPSVRRDEILKAAVILAVKIGYLNITRESVAATADSSEALVTRYFTTMDELKRAVMRQAIDGEILPIIAQGLSMGDTQVSRIKPELKQKVLSYLSI